MVDALYNNVCESEHRDYLWVAGKYLGEPGAVVSSLLLDHGDGWPTTRPSGDEQYEEQHQHKGVPMPTLNQVYQERLECPRGGPYPELGAVTKAKATTRNAPTSRKLIEKVRRLTGNLDIEFQWKSSRLYGRNLRKQKKAAPTSEHF
jgi:hypothetical protein